MYSTHYSCQILKKNVFFSSLSLKNPQTLNLMKFCLLGADMFHVDGETDIGTDGLNVTIYGFSLFCEKRITALFKAPVRTAL